MYMYTVRALYHVNEGSPNCIMYPSREQQLLSVVKWSHVQISCQCTAYTCTQWQHTCNLCHIGSDSMVQSNYSRSHSLIHSSMALQPFVRPWPILQFRNLFFEVGRTPWTGDEPVERPLRTHRTTPAK
jgi:hypothetical protein